MFIPPTRPHRYKSRQNSWLFGKCFAMSPIDRQCIEERSRTMKLRYCRCTVVQYGVSCFEPLRKAIIAIYLFIFDLQRALSDVAGCKVSPKFFRTFINRKVSALQPIHHCLKLVISNKLFIKNDANAIFRVFLHFLPKNHF